MSGKKCIDGTPALVVDIAWRFDDDEARDFAVARLSRCGPHCPLECSECGATTGECGWQGGWSRQDVAEEAAREALAAAGWPYDLEVLESDLDDGRIVFERE